MLSPVMLKLYCKLCSGSAPSRDPYTLPAEIRGEVLAALDLPLEKEKSKTEPEEETPAEDAE